MSDLTNQAMLDAADQHGWPRNLPAHRSQRMSE